MTLRYARLLVRPLSRSINWVPLAPASALGLLFVWLTARDAHAGLDEMIVWERDHPDRLASPWPALPWSSRRS